jgi:hypothetical protein
MREATPAVVFSSALIGVHLRIKPNSWMPGSSPGMTGRGGARFAGMMLIINKKSVFIRARREATHPCPSVIP